MRSRRSRSRCSRRSTSACSSCTTSTTKAPVVFQTRWTMSYLRGPLSSDQIRALTPESRPKPAAGASRRPVARAPLSRAASRSGVRRRGPERPRPIVAPGHPAVLRARPPRRGRRSYTPVVAWRGARRVRRRQARHRRGPRRRLRGAIRAGAVAVDWANGDAARRGDGRPPRARSPAGASFLTVPAPALQAKNYAAWKQGLREVAAQSEKLELMRHARPEADLGSRRERARFSGSAFTTRSASPATRPSTPCARSTRRGRRDSTSSASRAAVGRARIRAGVPAEAADRPVGGRHDLSGPSSAARRSRRRLARPRDDGGARRGPSPMKETADMRRASESVEAVQQQISELESAAREETQAIAAEDRRGAGPRPRAHAGAETRPGHRAGVALGWDPR